MNGARTTSCRERDIACRRCVILSGYIIGALVVSQDAGSSAANLAA